MRAIQSNMFLIPEYALKRVTEMKKLVRDVLISSKVEDYITGIIMATHPNIEERGNLEDGVENATDYVSRYIIYGAGPRGAQAIVLAAKVNALLDGRANVSYDDVDKVAVSAINHRLHLNFEADADNIKPQHIIEQILEKMEK